MAAHRMRACRPPDAACTAKAQPVSETDDDVDRIMEIMARAFAPEYGEAWNRRQVADSLILGGTRYFLIDAEGTFETPSDHPAAGFALTRGLFDEEELLLFAITPEHRRKGIGAALLKNVIANAKARGVRRLFLEMRRNNPAGRLYSAFGFRTVGIRPAYYRTASGDQLDALSQELVID
jgi:[ribosomal protein S18]-alanine N-acetyltransferase